MPLGIEGTSAGCADAGSIPSSPAQPLRLGAPVEPNCMRPHELGQKRDGMVGGPVTQALQEEGPPCGDRASDCAV